MAQHKISITLPASMSFPLGTRKNRAGWAPLTVDLTKLPAHVLAQIVEVGVINHVRACINETAEEHKAARAKEIDVRIAAGMSREDAEKATKDVVHVRSQDEAFALANAELARMYAGEITKRQSLSEVERMAIEMATQTILKKAHGEGRKVTRTDALEVAKTLPAVNPKAWENFMAKSRAEIEARAAEADKLGASLDLGALLGQ